MVQATSSRERFCVGDPEGETGFVAVSSRSFERTIGRQAPSLGVFPCVCLVRAGCRVFRASWRNGWGLGCRGGVGGRTGGRGSVILPLLVSRRKLQVSATRGGW